MTQFGPLYRGHVRPGPPIINLPRQGAPRAGSGWSNSDKQPLDSICKPIFIYDIGLHFLSPESHDSLPLRFIWWYLLEVLCVTVHRPLILKPFSCAESKNISSSHLRACTVSGRDWRCKRSKMLQCSGRAESDEEIM